MDAGPSPILPRVEAVLESLRRGHRHLTRNPRGAIEVAVKQLLAGVPGSGFGHPNRSEDSRAYRIDDLAREAAMTTRNIRAYQERGLLHPPRRSGRLALYGESHLARLRLISSMLKRGYTTAHITEMLTAWEHGKDLADVLGLEQALITPWAEDRPTTTTQAKARELAGSDDDLGALIDAGLIRKTGNRTLVERPKLLQAFAEMRNYGMPTRTVIDLHNELQPMIEQISQTLVRAGAQHVAHQLEADQQPNSTDLAELIPMLIRFRALSLTSVTASISTALETAVEELLGDYLIQLIDPSDTNTRSAS